MIYVKFRLQYEPSHAERAPAFIDFFPVVVALS